MILHDRLALQQKCPAIGKRKSRALHHDEMSAMIENHALQNGDIPAELQDFVDKFHRGEIPKSRENQRILRASGLRGCFACQTIKPFDGFCNRSDGTVDYCCKPCQSARKLRYRRACAAAARAVLPDLKLTKKGCASGGMTYKRLQDLLARQNLRE